MFNSAVTSHYSTPRIRVLMFRFLLIILLVQDHSFFAWQECNEGQGICPTGNTCCLRQRDGHNTCISGRADAVPSGSCCDETGEKGCGTGYTCIESQYCQRTSSDISKPDQLPPYKLCSLPDSAIKETYGLSMDQKSNSPQLAYLSTMGPIDSSDPELLAQHLTVHTLVVVVHGSRRNVDDYVCCMNSALPDRDQHPNHSSAIIIAPWFLAPNDEQVHFVYTNADALVWDDKGEMLEHTWRYGANAINANISSYAAIDEIVQRVLDDKVRFPNLHHIVVVGHSAGGQLVQRWSLLSNIDAFEDNKDMEAQTWSRAPLRVVVVNPKSFCYLDWRRMVNGTLMSPDEDDVENCPWYNDWEYGFGRRNIMPAPYKDQAIKDAGGLDAIFYRYQYRNIIYLAGELDVERNGDCMARMQGANRRERSQNFIESLEEIYGYPVHRRIIVRGVDHDHCLMFQSLEGQRAMFTDPGLFNDIRTE